MIETLRSDFPSDLNRAIDFPSMGTVESFTNDVVDHVKDYARENPIGFGLWALGIGFVLGWRLKPW